MLIFKKNITCFFLYTLDHLHCFCFLAMHDPAVWLYFAKALSFWFCFHKSLLGLSKCHIFAYAPHADTWCFTMTIYSTVSKKQKINYCCCLKMEKNQMRKLTPLLMICFSIKLMETMIIMAVEICNLRFA